MSLNPEVRRGGNLPFGMVASRWMCDPRYSTNARTLYAILVTYADTQGRDTAKGKPYRPELAAQMGVSVSTVDRTFVEMEVAGMVVIEERTDPSNPARNDANVYHLQDYPLMYAGNGEWQDPLSKGAKAADVAKSLIEKRRAEKRAQGVARKGGVPKGVNTRAPKEKRVAAEQEPDESERGSSTHAATPGSTHAATPAAPVLPNVYSPVENPDPEKDTSLTPVGLPAGSSACASESGSAASSESKPAGEQRGDSPPPRTGTPAEPAAQAAASGGRARESGSAASEQKSPSEKKKPKHTQEQRALAGQVIAQFPEPLLKQLRVVPALTDTILKALAGDVPNSDRTVEQLGERIMQRWVDHGHQDRWFDEGIRNPIGMARVLVRPLKPTDRYGCANPRCENGLDADDKSPCPVCPARLAERAAQQPQNGPQEPSGGPDSPSGSEVPAPRLEEPYKALPAVAAVPQRVCVNPECRQILPRGSDTELCHHCEANPAAAAEALDGDILGKGPAMVSMRSVVAEAKTINRQRVAYAPAPF